MNISRLKLIVTADDLGIGSERDEGILEAFHAGVVKCSSLLVNGDSTESAIRLCRDAGLQLGIHLNLTEGPPISDPSNVISLLSLQTSHWCDVHLSDKQLHEFRGRFGLVDALSKGQVSLEEVEIETAAQLERFRSLVGYPPTHLDGHQHVHVFPGIAAVVARVAARCGVRCVRIPTEPRCWYEHVQPAARRDYFDQVTSCLPPFLLLPIPPPPAFLVQTRSLVALLPSLGTAALARARVTRRGCPFKGDGDAARAPAAPAPGEVAAGRRRSQSSPTDRDPARFAGGPM